MVQSGRLVLLLVLVYEGSKSHCLERVVVVVVVVVQEEQEAGGSSINR